MTAAKRRKAERQATAAFAVSQPLFDALRIACIKIGDQKFHLTIARDLVQNLHVKLPGNGADADLPIKHERYIACVVKAWGSALEVYTDVLHNLAQVTAPVEIEGKPAAKGHEDFKRMAETAWAAKAAADAFAVPPTEEAKTQASAKASQTQQKRKREEEPQLVRKKQQVDSTPTNPLLLALLGKAPPPSEPQPAEASAGPQQPVERLSDKIYYDAQGRKVLWQRGAPKPNVPFSTLGSSEKKAWKAEVRRQKREKKLRTRAEKDVREAARKRAEAMSSQSAPQNGAANGHADPLDADYIPLDGTSGTRSMPAVEFEDVSAEVEARLKAKEDAKKAKKRKRESQGSEKPKRKKSKETSSEVQ